MIGMAYLELGQSIVDGLSFVLVGGLVVSHHAAGQFTRECNLDLSLAPSRER
jgi:hypothetical protein